MAKRMYPRPLARDRCSYGVKSSVEGLVSWILLGAECWMQVVCSFGAPVCSAGFESGSFLSCLGLQQRGRQIPESTHHR